MTWDNINFWSQMLTPQNILSFLSSLGLIVVSIFAIIIPRLDARKRRKNALKVIKQEYQRNITKEKINNNDIEAWKHWRREIAAQYNKEYEKISNFYKNKI